MSVAKVIEIVSGSETSFANAVQQGLAEESSTAKCHIYFYRTRGHQ